MKSPVIIKASNNTIVIEVDNLLTGWPSYVIDYTPTQPVTLKMILRLEDTSPYVWVDEEDSDTDEDNTQKLAQVPDNMRTMKATAKTLTVDVLCESTTPSNVPICMLVDATPVELHGLLKELTFKNLKHDRFIDDDVLWPPPRPHAFHKVEATTRFKTLKALTRLVKAVWKENK
ncbi:hypothetical protein PAXRUDRAFT_9953 [Paxillus rubicundulus Ve08.2h10]|uniref:Uncharacterized protein n=1 Tax=Paxillus rubicundulus Ve08.2h10 TaxID=930991 RepID=A0A0D0E7N2_9AGAM|nr:hypothetical protein PAXRUDRAFT_9953 [Paxillus rubicundulus Ve08.2h10]